MPGSPAMFTVTVKMSFRYISTGSPDFSPSAKAATGVVGVRMTSTSCEGLVEVALDQRAHLLRLEIIGVVIAGRQHIGADQDAPLHLVRRSPPRRVFSYIEITSEPGSRRP